MITLRQLLAEDKPRHRRLNAIGHFPGCGCEKCFPLVERAIEYYYPGFLPELPPDPHLIELEQANRRLRQENDRLRTELQRRPARKAQEPTERGGLDVDG